MALSNGGYDDPNYPPAAIIAISVILPLLTVVGVCARFYVRLRLKPQPIGIDDWMAAAASFLCLADGAGVIVATQLGICGHIWPDQIPPQRQHTSNKVDFAIITFEKPLYGMMKLSALLFYRRIFQMDRPFKIANTCLIVLVILWSTAYFLAECFQCGAHPETQWTDDGHKYSCVDQTWLNFSYAVTDVPMDLLVVLLPFPVIKGLKLRREEKAGVAAIFLLGAISTVAAIIRLGFISKAFTQNYGASGNTHGAGTPPVVWSIVEATIGVFAACLPPCGPIIKLIPFARFKDFASSVRSMVTSSKPRVTKQGSWPFERPSESPVELVPSPKGRQIWMEGLSV